MSGSADDILAFIQGNTADYWNKSSTELAQVLREDLFSID